MFSPPLWGHTESCTAWSVGEAAVSFFLCASVKRKGISFRCKFFIVPSVTWIRIESHISSSPERVKISSHAHTHVHALFFHWMDLHHFLFAQCNLGKPVGWNSLKLTSHLMSRLRFFFCRSPSYTKDEKDENIVNSFGKNREMKTLFFTVWWLSLTFVLYNIHDLQSWSVTLHKACGYNNSQMLVMGAPHP